DITHGIEKFNVFEGAFILYVISDYIPEDSVVVGVIDPTVGTQRDAIIVKTRFHYFVGPDNGLFSLVTEKEGIEKIVKIENPKFLLKKRGMFDGRDVFSPIAASLAMGVKMEEFGKVKNEIEKLDFPKPTIEENSIKVKVLYIDGFGNIVTNIKNEEFFSWYEHGKSLLLTTTNSNLMVGISTSYEESNTEVFFVEGSTGFLEISGKRKSASDYLKVKVGEEILIQKT
ncbi:MAG: SAM-dependent chlorinase/fluorinase, partial [Candidatus Aenigmarchaeota archaeon]|nr:SAM-dependent chlorinase/fluorinase [Candidatus Aenigmarchaeota archaeon]